MSTPRPATVARWVATLAAPDAPRPAGDLRPVVAQRHARARAATNLRAWGLDTRGERAPGLPIATGVRVALSTTAHQFEATPIDENAVPDGYTAANVRDWNRIR